MMTPEERRRLEDELLDLHFGCAEDPEGLEAALARDPELRALRDEVLRTAGLVEDAARATDPGLDFRALAARERQRRRFRFTPGRLGGVAAALLLLLAAWPVVDWGLSRRARAQAEAEDFDLTVVGSIGSVTPELAVFRVETRGGDGDLRPTEVSWSARRSNGTEVESGRVSSMGLCSLEIPATAFEASELVLEAHDQTQDVVRRQAFGLGRRLDTPTIHLTLDKPAYRPGETLRFRGVFLGRSDLAPAAGGLSLRIRDARDQIVQDFGRPNAVDGVVADSWPIASQIAGGEYRLEVLGPDNKLVLAQQAFRILRFRAPRLDQKLRLDRQSYARGDRGTAELTLRRLRADAPKQAIRVEASVALDGTVVWRDAREVLPDRLTTFDFEIPERVGEGRGRFVVVARDGGVVETAVETFFVPDGRHEVTFYPEGGHFVADRENRLYVEIFDGYGREADVRGTIRDEDDTIVADFRTDHQGRGMIELVPTLDDVWTLVLDGPIESRHPLPQPRARGVVLRALDVSTGAGKPVCARLDLPGDGPWITTLACRGEIVAQEILREAGAHEIALDAADGVGGVLRLTVYDRSLRPVAERLVHRASGRSIEVEVSAERPALDPGDRQTLQLRARDEAGRPVKAVLGVNVVDEALARLGPEERIGLADRTWLFGDVEELEDIEEFLVDDPDASRNIDLLLGTRGWRRLAWLDPAKLIEDEGDRGRRLLARLGLPASPMVAHTPSDRAPRLVSLRATESRAFAAARPWAALLGAIAIAIAATLVLLRLGLTPRGSGLVSTAILALLALWPISSGLDDWTRPSHVSGLFAANRTPSHLGASVADSLNPAVFTQSTLPPGYARNYLGTVLHSVTPLAPEQILFFSRSLDDQLGAQLNGMNGQIFVNTRSAHAPGAGADRILMLGGGALPADQAVKFPDNWAAAAAGGAGGPGGFVAGLGNGGMGQAAQSPAAGAFFFDNRKDVLYGRGFTGLVQVDGLPIAEAERGRVGRAFELRAEDIVVRENIKDETADALERLKQWNLERQRRVQFRLDQLRSVITARVYAHTRKRPITGPRRDFTESLYWHPLLTTDDDGTATLAFDTSDRVTTWAVHVDAHGAGRVGQTTERFRTRRPLTLDLVLPDHALEGDRLELPLAVRVAEDLDGEVTLTVSDLRGATLAAGTTATLKARVQNGRALAYCPVIVADEARELSLTVTARHGEATDAVSHRMSIGERGFPHREDRSGLIEKRDRFSVSFPDAARPKSLASTLRIYPSATDLLGEGLEGMLREPGGCFEQTSSRNYPNTLVLRYRRAVGERDAALEKRASDLLAKGYARLAGYECRERGYEWWGADPAHESLSAYGLLQFEDMRDVFNIDDAMVQRTRAWLLARRDGEGGFRISGKALDKFGRAPAEVTRAYCVWALLVAGTPPEELDVELATLEREDLTGDDDYRLALATLAFARAGRGELATRGRSRLRAAQAEDGGFDAAATITMSGGRDRRVEATALALLALLGDEDSAAAMRQAVSFLVSQRRGSGTFGATQATVMALKALTAHAEAHRTPRGSGTISVRVNGRVVQRLAYGALTQGVLEIADFHRYLEPGENEVELISDGDEVFPWTFDLTYRSDRPASDEDCPVALTIGPPAAPVRRGEVMSLPLTVENLREDGLPMVIARVGIPAGLSILPDVLDALRDEERFAFWETHESELVLYWRDLAPGERVSFPIEFEAMIPGRSRGRASRVHLYYAPESTAFVAPLEIDVMR